MTSDPLFPNVPILLADESIFVRRLVRGMLLQVGIRDVVDVADGDAAIERLAEIKPGLIIMQWEIPGWSAAEILNILRDPTKVTEAGVPVIVITERPTRRVVNAAAERQVQHVLRKPFSPKMLWERVAEFLPDQRTLQLDERILPKLKKKETTLRRGEAIVVAAGRALA